MKIDLNQEIEEHFQRLKDLAEDAENDAEEKLSGRAAAMSALSSMLRELTKTQAEVINMARLQRIEKVTVDVMKEYLSQKQMDDYLSRLEEALQ